MMMMMMMPSSPFPLNPLGIRGGVDGGGASGRAFDPAEWKSLGEVLFERVGMGVDG